MESELEEMRRGPASWPARAPRARRVREIPTGDDSAAEGKGLQPLVHSEELRQRSLVVFFGRGLGIIRRAFRVKDLDEALRECQGADDEIEWAKVLQDGEVIAGFVRRGATWLTSARTGERGQR
jgi:hypothetical protein